jgi:hypothetical protein
MSDPLEETFLNKIAIDGDVLARALSYDGEAITNLTDTQLSSTLYDLSKYQIYLQLHANIRTANYAAAKRAFESELGKVLISLKASSKATSKEKIALAIQHNERLQQLEENVATTEMEEILFRKVPEQAVELVNALKKELSRRMVK